MAALWSQTSGRLLWTCSGSLCIGLSGLATSIWRYALSYPANSWSHHLHRRAWGRICRSRKDWKDSILTGFSWSSGLKIQLSLNSKGMPIGLEFRNWSLRGRFCIRCPRFRSKTFHQSPLWSRRMEGGRWPRMTWCSCLEFKRVLRLQWRPTLLHF